MGIAWSTVAASVRRSDRLHDVHSRGELIEKLAPPPTRENGIQEASKARA